MSMNNKIENRALLPRVSPLALLAAGRQAFREVPGLRLFLLKGLVLNYLIFIITAMLGMGVLYYLIIEPIGAELSAWSAGGGFLLELLSQILRVLLWIANILLMAGTVVLSLLVSLAVVSIWFEALAGRIIAHWRAGEEELTLPVFSFKELVISVWGSLRASLLLIILACLALALGFIPLIGPVLVFVIDSFLLGWEVRNPYLVVREGLGDEPKGLRKGLRLWTLGTGLLPLLLAAIPFAGWLLLPAAMTYLVAGVAWRGEQAFAEKGE